MFRPSTPPVAMAIDDRQAASPSTSLMNHHQQHMAPLPFLSRPPSPPTPAPSPQPVLHATSTSIQQSNSLAIHDDSYRPPASNLGPLDLGIFSSACQRFTQLSNLERQKFLAYLLEHCDTQQLVFVNNFISPRLKRDFLRELPTEIALHILSFIDEPQTLSRAASVSKSWWSLLNHESTWRLLCSKHKYVDSQRSRLGFGNIKSIPYNPFIQLPTEPQTPNIFSTPLQSPASSPFAMSVDSGDEDGMSNYVDSMASPPFSSSPAFSYRNHFKYRFLVDQNWRHGGRHVVSRLPTPVIDVETEEGAEGGDNAANNVNAPGVGPGHPQHGLNVLPGGVVTSLQMSKDYITIGLDSSEIHVFNARGTLVRTLIGHENGVWALHLMDDILVSGGCDRNIRVWNIRNGHCKHILRGHTSTIRCLKMQNKKYAVSGSRDTTLRVWDIENGRLEHLLLGHQSSVRCLEIHGDIVVSGSYDYTARVWSISSGRCLQTLRGHGSQIYAIRFDGKKVITGSLDMTVRVWNPISGECLGVLAGHTQLVGQLQLSDPLLVTGGSDGALRMWSVDTNECLHRVAAHDNSVTCLQFDERRIVSGGSDGKVKVWDLESGRLIRELTEPAGAVWQLAFEETRCVVLVQRGSSTYLEVIDFEPLT